MILANLIPAAPFVILVMTPFIEQIDPNLESAARVFGASTARMFMHILVPLLAPGILAASLLVLVRTIALFELTFLTAGPDSQTLVVALYYAVFAAGVRAPQSVDAMAMIYMVGHAGLAADRAAVRQSDATRQPRKGASAAGLIRPLYPVRKRHRSNGAGPVDVVPLEGEAMKHYWQKAIVAAVAAALAGVSYAKEFRSADVHPDDYPTVMAVKYMGDCIKQKTGGKDIDQGLQRQSSSAARRTRSSRPRSARSTWCASTSRR